MKYYKQLSDGRLMQVSRTTYWRLQKSSGYIKEYLDSDCKLIGMIFIPVVI